MAAAPESPNEKGQLPMVDALLDQTEGKFCLSYKVNSIFSGSCAQNNSHSVAPAVLYFTANCTSHSSTVLQVIVCNAKECRRPADTCVWGSRVGRSLNPGWKLHVCRPVEYWAPGDKPWLFSTAPEFGSCVNGRPNVGLQQLYSAATIFTLFFPPNRMLQNSADFESRKIFWGLQTKYKFWTELNHCFFFNVYGRENLICSKWSSLLCQCFRCGLGYLHQENIISAHCTSCNSLTLLTFFLHLSIH